LGLPVHHLHPDTGAEQEIGPGEQNDKRQTAEDDGAVGLRSETMAMIGSIGSLSVRDSTNATARSFRPFAAALSAVLVVLKANHRGRRAGGRRPISRRRRANQSGETPLAMAFPS
jgi:hypothetical protein